MIGATGPNVSSSRMRMPAVIPVRTVGEKNSPLRASSSDHGARPLGHGVLHVRRHLLEPVPIDQRPHLRLRIHRIADPQTFHDTREPAGELVVNAVLHVDAVGADARLPGVAELRCDHFPHGGIDVRIVEHQERRVPAELERHPLHGPRRLRREQHADLGAAGERELADRRVVEEHRGDRGRIGRGEHLEHLGRTAGLAPTARPGRWP